MAEAETEREGIVLRVEVTSEDFRKLQLQERPGSVEILIAKMKDILELSGDFRLQYFDISWNKWFNLTSIDEIKDKDSLKVIHTSLIDDPSLEGSLLDNFLDTDFKMPAASEKASTASVDTDIYSDTETSSLESYRKARWPDVFPIPTFSFQTERLLLKGNKDFKEHGTNMPISGIKTSILEKLAEKIYAYKAYPTDVEIEKVAKALIEKHPCLKEPGSVTGFYGWKQSIKFKMGNYRSKLRGQGCEELAVNATKRKGADDKQPAKNVKKPRKAEVNFLPDFPDDESEATSEITRVFLLDEYKKKNNLVTVNDKMEKTFPYRRQEVVLKQPMITTFKTRWPALFTHAQIRLEFGRITTVQLEPTFYSTLDKFTPKLLELLKGKGGQKGKQIQSILATLEKDNIDSQREVVIKALIEYLNEDSSALIKEFQDAPDSTKDITMGIVVINEDSDLEATKIVLEGEVVLEDLDNVPQATAMLFGLIYCLNLSYPKTLKYFFEAMQNIFMKLDDGKSPTPKVLSLKNKLLSK